MDYKLLNSLEVIFGPHLQNANLEEIPPLRLRQESTPELFSFLKQHGIHSVTMELHGTTIILRNFKRLNDSNKEVDGDNGLDVQENLVCSNCRSVIGELHHHDCRHQTFNMHEIVYKWQCREKVETVE